MADRFRCATESRAASEPIFGTASRVRRWLAIEQPGPWGPEALIESRLDVEIGMTLRSVGRRLGVRVLLIRRPGWRDDSVGARRVYLARTGHRSSWIEQLDLDDARQLLDLDLESLASEAPPGVGEPGPEVVYLVCTHGRHDACCADFGRPVVRTLAESSVPEVWESSHVGGDRFAANIVCLPSGVYFGRVDAEEAEALLAGFARGELDLDHYRGRSCFSPLLQSAELFLRRERQVTVLHGLALEHATREGDDRLVARFQHGDDIAIVTVERERAAATQLTCTAAAPSEPWRYRLVSIAAESA